MSSIDQSRRRLSCQHGHWILETSTLVRLERDVYGPQRRNIQGPEAILAHLRSRGEGVLVAGAEHLIRGTRDGNVAYEEKDGSWIESSPSLAPVSRSDQLEAEVTELRAEVIMLRAVCSGLTSRLGRLERLLMKGAKLEAPAGSTGGGQPIARETSERSAAVREATERSAAVREATERSAAVREATERGDDASAGQGSKPAIDEASSLHPGPSSADVSGEPEPDAARSSPDAANVSDEGAAVPDVGPPVALPGGAAVMTCLRQLTGEPIHLDKSSEKLPESSDEMALLQAAVLVDDDGRERAALLADNRAIVQCGGLLLGMPKPAIAEMADAGESTPDLLLAMSEIFNNLSGVVNHEAGNPHLRAQALEQASLSRLPWLASPSVQAAFRTPNGGQIWLVAC